VDDPETADYLVLCQNHIVDHSPFHGQFRPLKDQYKSKTIMMDFDDDPNLVRDRHDFRWALYFKRSCVDQQVKRPIDYGELPVIPTAYGVVDAMVEPPAEYNGIRDIAISCLFADYVCSADAFAQGRGRLLAFAKALAARHDFPMQIGPVSSCGPEGRMAINEQYKRCLFNSKIVLHANPDHWEGDARLWEAICSGALVFVDRMCQPIPHPLVDGEHVIFYDLSANGFAELERKIVYYLEHDEERARIGQRGRAFVLERHRSINRINEMIWQLESRAADKAELAAIREQDQKQEEQGAKANRSLEGKPLTRSVWQTPEFLESE
jgi:glycosyltransferase involved in cell wall biosynthesis